jgi:hypothetical protein
MAATDVFSGVPGVYTRYAVEIQVREWLIGGTPKDPDTIRKWLRARLEMDDRAIIELANEVAQQMTAERVEKAKEGEDPGRPSAEEILEATARQFEGGNGFKTIDGQLVYEGRCMKAALKEAANVAYPGTTWPGKPQGIKKGLMRYLAERVFVEEQQIPLGVTQPSGTEQRIKHVMTPEGPRSAINVVDYVEKPTLSFTVRVLDDFLPQQAWARIWENAENIGIGADRARSDGKFDLLRWDRIN